jgi:hypothetical protein
MALEAAEAPARMSMDDIAASILVKADPAPQEDKDETATDDADQIVETASENDADYAETDEVGDSDVPTDDAAEADDENFESIQLTDDTLIPVTVDGQDKEVTLADLKRAYSGEGAIEKRLQLATETKKQAENLKVQVEQELNTGRQNLVKAFSAFESLMFQPQVSQPDPALRQTNPTQYLIQMEAWREEQAGLQAKRSKVQQAVTLFQQQEAEKINQMKVEVAQKLVEAMPALRDPVKGPELQKMMYEGARAYGFNDADISGILDHRMYLALADLAAYARLKAKGQSAPVKPQKSAPVMRPGATKAVASATAYARNQKAALETARKSGKVDDIAATLLVRKPKR